MSAGRHRLPWTVFGLAVGAVAVLGVQHLPARPAAGPEPETPTATTAGRTVAPLERQADTGAVAIAPAALRFRSERFVIELPSGDEAGHEVEQKLRLYQGGTLAWRWSVSGIDNPEEFYADLHGHAPPAPGFREASYRQGGGLEDSGSLQVPFDGIHGWLFKNDSASAAVVTLEVAGFYEPVSAVELAAIEEQILALSPH